jgi:hypothetical protein
MGGTGCSAFALHLDDLGDHAPQIGSPPVRPGVGVLAHRRRRGDGVDGDDLAGGIRHLGGGLVPVQYLDAGGGT